MFDTETSEVTVGTPSDGVPDGIGPGVLLDWAESELPSTGLLLEAINPASLDADGQLRLAELWARVEAHAAARKLTALAAFTDPAPVGRSPYGEFADCEVGA